LPARAESKRHESPTGRPTVAVPSVGDAALVALDREGDKNNATKKPAADNEVTTAGLVVGSARAFGSAHGRCKTEGRYQTALGKAPSSKRVSGRRNDGTVTALSAATIPSGALPSF
jgi:hypothetical protein